ncbi:hypothetical protein ILYODFUR_014284 [Ilyodon furcidens]|uniref:Uncharacterized protein n=1 Tax=Ilyodon furcidens TaxID=33524 RepID=A0ABV0TIJ9_9TELE
MLCRPGRSSSTAFIIYSIRFYCSCLTFIELRRASGACVPFSSNILLHSHPLIHTDTLEVSCENLFFFCSRLQIVQLEGNLWLKDLHGNCSVNHYNSVGGDKLCLLKI